VSSTKSRSDAIHSFRPEAVVSALAVSSHVDDLAFLRGVFGDAGWTLHEAPTLTDGLILIKRRPLDLVITDRDAANGGWRRMLDALKSQSAPLPLIVTSRLADDYLWAEVLNEGGYDVLAQPFDREEVVRVISAATRHNHNANYHTRHKPLVLTAGM
jgi:two-component system, OmpR family, KDP operon response regulator KdpE